MKVAIIGAGITGITTAYSLAKRGVDVTVYDRNRYAGMLTSYANGGQLSVSNSEVWTTWANIFKGMKWMFTKDAPLLVHPYPSVSKVKWLYEFIKNTATSKYYDNTRETIMLGLRAREVYLQIAEDEKINFDLTKKGILHFYKNESYFESAKKALDTVYKIDELPRQVLNNAKEVHDIEPSINLRGIIGGIYTPSDMNGDIHKFCIDLTKVLKSRYGVRFYFEDECILEELEYSYDHIVVCAGIESAKISKILKDPINIYPVKGYSITLDVKDANQGPHVSLLDDEKKIVISRLDNRLRVAGTAELADINYDITHTRIKPLVEWVRNNFPNIETEHVNPWAGLRPMTPSMLPVVRKSKADKYWYNTGHGHLGWTLSAATAEVIAEQIVSR
jgi:D-amino-acid dehydrogenase